jgi:hypothetical protein
MSALNTVVIGFLVYVVTSAVVAGLVFLFYHLNC